MWPAINKRTFELPRLTAMKRFAPLVSRAIKNGDIRRGLSANDLLRAIVGVANVASVRFLQGFSKTIRTKIQPIPSISLERIQVTKMLRECRIAFRTAHAGDETD
jgi:hypothetical protein